MAVSSNILNRAKITEEGAILTEKAEMFQTILSVFSRHLCNDSDTSFGTITDSVKSVVKNIQGRGVFTTKQFEKGEFMFEYRGNLTTVDPGFNEYAFEFIWNSRKCWIDASIDDKSLGRLVNDDENDSNSIVKRIIEGNTGEERPVEGNIEEERPVQLSTRWKQPFHKSKQKARAAKKKIQELEKKVTDIDRKFNDITAGIPKIIEDIITSGTLAFMPTNSFDIDESVDEPMPNMSTPVSMSTNLITEHAEGTSQKRAVDEGVKKIKKRLLSRYSWKNSNPAGLEFLESRIDLPDFSRAQDFKLKVYKEGIQRGLWIEATHTFVRVCTKIDNLHKQKKNN
ncbi:unnamed protein product [Mytilus coruscus]|uniref:Uncharacterized protein n=1 Tax=Mytilus coruscus TaxID=42192 RepID=A0A6J8CZS5_MYTCO|nr:unnamed protein product [Mytilus coruscus]